MVEKGSILQYSRYISKYEYTVILHCRQYRSLFQAAFIWLWIALNDMIFAVLDLALMCYTSSAIKNLKPFNLTPLTIFLLCVRGFFLGIQAAWINLIYANSFLFDFEFIMDRCTKNYAAIIIAINFYRAAVGEFAEQ